jgi:folate-binding protein YgfZ
MTLPSISGTTELTHLGVIRVTGDDAVTFLQGQLTQDVALMGSQEARLAAFCNAKGRMQASFVVFKHGTDVLLVCNRDIQPATLKRLSMFVLRAKAKLSDASAEFALYGVAGAAVAQVAGRAGALWEKMDLGDASLVFLHPGAGQARALWCAPAGSPAPEGPPPISLADWQWLGVQSGIAMITQPIFEAFVPQMLNYESVGGVNFKKGCYPGQEIVARSQFRGTLKRRAYVAHTAGTPSVGQEVFHASDAGQPCGTVAAAAPNPAGGFDAIVSMQTSAAADGRLTLGSAAGEALALLPLPYALLEDI